MFQTLILALMLVQTAAPGRYEMGERVKSLDRQWLVVNDEAKRRQAVQEISVAVGAFFSARASDACKALDRARAALEGRNLTPGDAVALRASKPVFAPGETVTILQTWAYNTEGEPPTLKIGEKTVTLEFGKTKEISVDPTLIPAPDADVVLEADCAGVKHFVAFSLIKNFDSRLEKLRQSDSRLARDLAEGIRAAISEQAETSFPIARMLKEAEGLDSGSLKPHDIEEIMYARQGNTVLRAFIPKSVETEATVVVALHGAGGSENLFFEGYGAGIAVREAKKRGWVFLAPRATPSGAKNALDWLKEVRGIQPKRLFVMGHSMGGGLALATGALKPNALALFAPAARTIPPDLAETPIFLAVGKQEMMLLRSNASALATVVKRKGEFREYDPCEHLMIVADAVPDAFRFFDAR
jgi:predicted esterase